MSGHTPGPWKKGPDGRVVATPHGVTVAFCGTGFISGPDGAYDVKLQEARANASLVSAAPDLLEALKMIHARRIAWPLEIEARVVGAIAKAEGE